MFRSPYFDAGVPFNARMSIKGSNSTTFRSEIHIGRFQSHANKDKNGKDEATKKSTFNKGNSLTN